MKNKLKFRYMLIDIWFSSNKNLLYIKATIEKDLVCALKANRLIAKSEDDYNNKLFISIEDLPWQEETLFTGWLKDVPFPLLIVGQVFVNKDGSTGILYLAC